MSVEILANGVRGGEPGRPHRPRAAKSRRRSAPPFWMGRQAPASLTIDVEDYYHVAAFRGVVRREDWDWYPSRVEPLGQARIGAGPEVRGRSLGGD